ncbi:MAG TPA: hypothetical protein PKA77_02075 [Chitinophagaceae bacterium]|nr:hypothetical protein [Chitinophagaceae bacterium]HMU58550.1 hypothetical protein [Chitinophagaceae bacterium]
MGAEVDLKLKWQVLEEKLAERFGKKPDLNAILFLIGVQEAGIPKKEFTKEEKTDLMHVAVCTILVPGRYYELMWVEDTGWPHFKQLQRMPEMATDEQEEFLKKYIIRYFEKNKFI